MSGDEKYIDVVEATSGSNVLPRFYAFLDKQIQDRGNLALEKLIYLIDRESRGETQFHRPALSSLIYWGEQGLITIKEIAVKKPTHKNVSGALSILSCLAANRTLNDMVVFNFHNDDFTTRLNQHLSTLPVNHTAKRLLGELALELEVDDLVSALSSVFMSSFEPGKIHESSIREVISALSSKWVHFGTATLNELKALIKDHPWNEPEFHKLFTQYPQLLDPMAIQVWSKPALHGSLIPDFIIRRVDNSYLVIEIECPGKLLITQGNQLTAEATHAEKQVTEYQTFLNDRISEMQKHFPFLRDPDGLVIIGNMSSLTKLQREALERINRSRHKVKIVSFDWILERAQSIISNMNSMQIEVSNNYRVV